MSVTYSRPALPSPTVPQMLEELKAYAAGEPTQSLIEAFAKFQITQDSIRKLDKLERDAARMVMDEMDKQAASLAPAERAALRKFLLDTLGWYRREMQKWVEWSLPEASGTSTDASPP